MRNEGFPSQSAYRPASPLAELLQIGAIALLAAAFAVASAWLI